jgi:hypothetical protein
MSREKCEVCEREWDNCVCFLLYKSPTHCSSGAVTRARHPEYCGGGCDGNGDDIGFVRAIRTIES